MSRKFWTREEDKILRDNVGKLSASVIGTLLGRPKNGVHHRIAKLGLDGRLCGENHWNAKIDNLQAAMVGTLYDAGWTTTEIYRAWVNPPKIKLTTLNDIAACRTHRGR